MDSRPPPPDELPADGPAPANSAPPGFPPLGRRRARRHARSLVLAWLVVAVPLGALGAIWSLSSPIGAGPDETSHLIKAAALVRGEWLGVHVPGSPGADMRVVVATTYRNTFGTPACYAHDGDVTPVCVKARGASSRLVVASTHTGRYPPLYYLLVGLPTLVSSASWTLTAMRLVSVMTSAALLAWALVLVVRFARSPLAIAGVCAAVTPVVVFLASVIEPNGLEATLGIVVLTAAGLLAFDPGEDRNGTQRPVPRLLVHTAGAATAALCLVRALSPLWALCVASVLVVAMGPARLSSIARDASARAWAGVIVLAGLAQVAWVIGAHALDALPGSHRGLAHRGGLAIASFALGHSSGFLRGELGIFTFANTQLPATGYDLEYASLALLVAVGLWRATRRQRVAIALLLAEVVLVPVGLVVASARADGFIWQGRYGLPLAVGVPILAGLAASNPSRGFRRGEARRDGRALWPVADVAVALVLGAQGLGLAGLIRRYSVGLKGPLDPLFTAHTSWDGPLPPQLAAWSGVVLLGVLGAIYVATRLHMGREARSFDEVHSHSIVPGGLEVTS